MPKPKENIRRASARDNNEQLEILMQVEEQSNENSHSSSHMCSCQPSNMKKYSHRIKKSELESDSLKSGSLSSSKDISVSIGDTPSFTNKPVRYSAKPEKCTVNHKHRKFKCPAAV